MAAGFITAGVQNCLPRGGEGLAGVAWWATLLAISWGGGVFIAWSLVLAHWHLTKKHGASPTLEAIVAYGAIAISLVLSVAIPFGLIVWSPGLVLPAAGVAGVVLLVASAWDVLRRKPEPGVEMSGQPAIRREMVRMAVAGLAAGAVVGVFAMLGLPANLALAARAAVGVLIVLLLVGSAFLIAPATLGSYVRWRRPAGPVMWLMVLAATAVAGFGLAWAVISIVRPEPASEYLGLLPGQAVADKAGVLSPGVEAGLESRIDSIEARSGAEVVVYLQVKAGATGESDLALARALTALWEIGGADGTGLVILVSFSEDRQTIQVSTWAGERMLPVLSDAEQARLRDAVVIPPLRAGDAERAMIEALEFVDRAIC